MLRRVSEKRNKDEIRGLKNYTMRNFATAILYLIIIIIIIII
jgi:hypothetical protein